ncbi:hypothetical protein [Pseudomonas laurylsulfatiphila]|uniref:hypothetical protein n=1 Tax=Pseudomonas laurylsulfatiphila TaxID=2011015 RepID=UPI002160A512|nr:hypothetical protein [Pseudomonas laurylsulfatiphila]UVM03006.1 hypothetical protein LOY25_18365 [Pseudomonas laurylsulfatiphila]
MQKKLAQNKPMIKFIALIVFGGLAGWATYAFKLDFSYSDFKDYGNTLLAVSGMVFTIMGIWIAFVYPNAILRLQDPNKIKTGDFSRTLQDTRRLEAIVGSIMASAFVASAVTGIYFCKLLLAKTIIVTAHLAAIKAFGIGFIAFLTAIQSVAIFYVIYSNYLFIEDLHVRREFREGDNDF